MSYQSLRDFTAVLACLKFDKNVLEVFTNLLKDGDIRSYILRNFLFEVPFINKKEFVKDARKIVPSLSENDLSYAVNFGGVRPQVIDRNKKRLELGEGKISTGEGISFNMTPSPGATSCFETARADMEEICKFLGKNFDEEKFNAEFFG